MRHLLTLPNFLSAFFKYQPKQLAAQLGYLYTIHFRDGVSSEHHHDGLYLTPKMKGNITIQFISYNSNGGNYSGTVYVANAYVTATREYIDVKDIEFEDSIVKRIPSPQLLTNGAISINYIADCQMYLEFTVDGVIYGLSPHTWGSNITVDDILPEDIATINYISNQPLPAELEIETALKGSRIISGRIFNQFAKEGATPIIVGKCPVCEGRLINTSPRIVCISKDHKDHVKPSTMWSSDHDDNTDIGDIF
jgi:hypothetical protein